MAAEHGTGANECPSAQLCRDISENLGGWSNTENGVSERKGTWASWPFRYVFTQFDPPHPVGAAYRVARLAVPYVDTGLSRFDAFYVAADGEVLHEISGETDIDDLDASTHCFVESARFAFANGLTAANSLDAFDLEASLKQGFMDGVEPL